MDAAKLNEIKQFNSKKKAVVLDKSISIRKGIESCLLRLGITSDNICSVSRFHDAISFVSKERPNFIFTEFQVGDRFGLELSQELDKLGVLTTERAFFMVTSNSQDSAVAEAAEEEVDAYIVKPFSIDSLETQIVRVIDEKMRPTPYFQEIFKGRKFLETKDPQNALVAFKKALELSKKTALAHYYAGQSYEMLNQHNEALNHYLEGLRQHPGHYKCKIGKFEVLDRLGRQAEAYEVIKKVLAKYPLTPQRLGKVFILAIYTKNFADVNKYYSIFLKVERRPEELIKIVTAGLYACGKHFCSLNKFDEAVQFFKKASSTSSRNADYLKKIIETLMQFKQGDLASEFLSQYSVEDQATDSWKALDFHVSVLQLPPDRVVQKGRKLITDGIREVSVYIEVAKILMKQDKKSHAENVVFAGIERCPQNREELLKILT